MGDYELNVGFRNIELLPNTFQTPNDVVDILMRLLTPTEFKVYMTAVRQILGWRDKIVERRDNISLTQFEDLTGISRKPIIKALNSLTEYSLLAKIEKDTQKGTLWELCEGRYVSLDGLELRLDKKARGWRKSTHQTQ